VKTVVVECRFVIEVPWDHEPQYSTDEHIRFAVEENSCPGTSAVGSALEALMEVANKNNVCWACAVGGENKILSIEDREPRNYDNELTPIKTEVEGKCESCGKPVIEKHQMRHGLSQSSFTCSCGAFGSSMHIGLE